MCSSDLIKDMGERAYEYTRSWAAGQKVRLELDVEQRDKYGRLLAYVYLPFPRPPLARLERLAGMQVLGGEWIKKLRGRLAWLLRHT